MAHLRNTSRDEAPSAAVTTAITNGWSLGEVLKLRRHALRTGAWWRELTRVERALVDATVEFMRKVRVIVKSRALVMTLHKVAQKVRFVAAGFIEMALSMGRELAARYVCLALSWGNNLATEWLKSPCYAVYLGIASQLHRQVYNFAPRGVD